MRTEWLWNFIKAGDPHKAMGGTEEGAEGRE